MKDIQVKDIMNTDVVYVKPQDSLKKVVQILDKHNFKGLPVVDEKKKVVGIVTERDILKYTRWVIGQPVKDLRQLFREGEEEVAKSEHTVGQRAVDVIELVASVTVGNLMTEAVFVEKGDLHVLKLVKMMNENDINRIPIVNERKELIGIVTREDILKVFEMCFENYQDS